MKFGKHAAIGLALDVFDFIGIGLLPGVGDVVDVVAVFYWSSKLGPAGLVGAIELLPAVDLLPVNTALGMMVDAKLARAQLQ